ncbi:hypothetical protein ACLQ25_00660 [Micromonospora sp. DT44]|uniref:hypothetical protein n=1 Tax=Micromonospora sp. DT44 TaxID=3393439 RepID=UPI003CE80DE6
MSALLAVGVVLVAIAVPTPAVAAPVGSFTRQALSAGLSRTQANGLQGKIDNYVQTYGGRQISANQVDFDGGLYTATVPGEPAVRNLSAAAASVDHCTGAAPLYSGWFCAYRSAGFQGDQLQWYNCGRYNMPWAGTGSWINNQSDNTDAYLLNRNLSVVVQSFAYDASLSVNWTPVWYVDVCY